MGRREGGGAPKTKLAPTGWGYGGLLVGIDIVSRVIPNSFQVMIPESAFERRCGVEIRLLRRHSQGCLA
jgi:hypothetical protein